MATTPSRPAIVFFGGFQLADLLLAYFAVRPTSSTKGQLKIAPLLGVLYYDRESMQTIRIAALKS